MTKEVKYAFYIFSPTNFQDMLPLLFEALRRNEKCWVCFFDCLKMNRELEYYTQKELFEFVRGKCFEYGLSIPDMSMFSRKKKDLLEYRKMYYYIMKPKIIFIQDISDRKKHAKWMPITNLSKVVHLAWNRDARHAIEPFTNIDFIILRHESDREYYEQCEVKYFGNLRMDHLLYYNDFESYDNIVFIPETYIRLGNKIEDDGKKIIEFYDKMIGYLQKNGKYVVWKCRQKGKRDSHGKNFIDIVDMLNNKPNKVIEKDLYFPSSIIEYGHVADLCIVFNVSWSFFDLIELNKNTIVIKTPGYMNCRQPKSMEEIFNGYNIVDMIDGELSKIDKYFDIKSSKIIKKLNVSRKIFNYIENNLI